MSDICYDVRVNSLSEMKAKLVFCIWVLINMKFIFWGEANIFLDAFAKLQKANISFVKSVPLSLHPSVCPQETTRLPMEGASWSVIFWRFFENLSGKSNFIKTGQEKRVINMKTDTYSIISRTCLLRITNASDKSCWENKKHILCSVTIFRKSCFLWDNVETYCRARQATDGNMAHAHCTLGT